LKISNITTRDDYDALVAETLDRWSETPRTCGETEILTFSGRHIDLLSPRLSDIDPVDLLHSLCHTSRFTGHTANFFSIAQHSTNVWFLCSKWAKPHAVAHDAIETYIGDDSSPKKRAVRLLTGGPRSGLDNLKDRFDPLVHQRLGLAFPANQSIKNEITLFDQVAMHYESKALLPEPVCSNPIESWGKEFCDNIERNLSHEEFPISQVMTAFAQLMAATFPHIAPELSNYLPKPVLRGPGLKFDHACEGKGSSQVDISAMNFSPI